MYLSSLLLSELYEEVVKITGSEVGGSLVEKGEALWHRVLEIVKPVFCM